MRGAVREEQKAKKNVLYNLRKFAREESERRMEGHQSKNFHKRTLHTVCNTLCVTLQTRCKESQRVVEDTETVRK